MKVIDVLKKTKGSDLKSLAAELEVGQKRFSDELKKLGAYYSEKEKCWVPGEMKEEILQQDFYEIVPKKGAKRNATQKVSKPKNKEVTKSDKKETNNTENQIVTNPENNPSSKPDEQPLSKEMNQEEIMEYLDKLTLKKVTYEIEEWLHDELKIKSVREKRKVSDIVNELLKKGLGH